MHVFAASREGASLDDFAAVAATEGPPLPIVAAIAGFEYHNASGRLAGPYDSEVVYRFTAFRLPRVAAFEWTVHGFGQFDFDREIAQRSAQLPRGEAAINVEAVRRAVDAATARFVVSFEQVPEPIRFARGQPLVGVDVPASLQATRTTPAPAAGVDAGYAGAFDLRVERVALPAPSGEPQAGPTATVAFMPLRVTLHNRGTRWLLILEAAVDVGGATRTRCRANTCEGRDRHQFGTAPQSGKSAGKPHGCLLFAVSPPEQLPFLG